MQHPCGIHAAIVALALAACGGHDDASAPALSTAFSATTTAKHQSMPARAAPSTARRAPDTPLDAAALDAFAPSLIDWAPCPELASVECATVLDAGLMPETDGDTVLDF